MHDAVEGERRSTLGGSLWYPQATIPDFEMDTQGQYFRDYPKGAVIHYTAGRARNETDALNTMRWGLKQGHAYMVIGPTGRVYQSHPLDEWGYHAGRASHPTLGHHLSSQLVGIEVACPGKLGPGNITWWGERIRHYVTHEQPKDNIKAGSYCPFTTPQVEALVSLLIWLKANNPKVFHFEYVVGHDEISKRKSDPGGSLPSSMPRFRSMLAGRFSKYFPSTPDVAYK